MSPAVRRFPHARTSQMERWFRCSLSVLLPVSLCLDRISESHCRWLEALCGGTAFGNKCRFTACSGPGFGRNCHCNLMITGQRSDTLHASSCIHRRFVTESTLCVAVVSLRNAVGRSRPRPAGCMTVHQHECRETRQGCARNESGGS